MGMYIKTGIKDQGYHAGPAVIVHFLHIYTQHSSILSEGEKNSKQLMHLGQITPANCHAC